MRRGAVVAVWFATLSAIGCAGGGGDASGPTTPATPVPVSTVVVAPGATTLAVGATQQLSATIRDVTGTVLTGRALTWTSSDANVATVNASGLATAAGPGSATITALSEGKSGTASLTAFVPVDSVAVAPATATITGGATQTYTATAFDASGNVLSGRTFAWASSNLAAATVSANGAAAVVTGAAPGDATISATSEGHTGTAGVTVVAGPTLSITIVSPSPLIEGATATISGTGFTAAASVTVAGLTAPVTSTSATQIQIVVPRRDCQPPRNESIMVTVGAASASTQALVKGTDATTLNAGFFVYSGADQCVVLAPGPTGAKYVIGMVSTGADPAAVTPSQLMADAGLATAAISALPMAEQQRVASWSQNMFAFRAQPLPGAATLGVTRPDRSAAEGRIRDAERRLFTSANEVAARAWMRARTNRRGLAAAQAALAVDDTLTMNVINGTPSCSSAPSVRAVVRYIGADNIWLEDVANPVPAFTTSDYAAMESFYASTTKPALGAYIGAFSDVDANQHTIVLITKEVNKQPSLLGFVWGGDLFPTSLCATSNAAEIFYGQAPDPAGTFGTPRTATEVAASYRSLMAHELTHVIQDAQMFLGTAGAKKTWEVEGGATLSEQLVGFRVNGYASGQNLAFAAVQSGTEWFENWVVDLMFYNGYASNTTRVVGAPEQCTWIGRPSEGNSGPCGNALRAVYGVPATLFRYVLDTYGPAYPGGEAALMQNIVGSPQSGYASLTTPTGTTSSELLTRFGLALWSDGKTSNALTSWDLADIFGGLVASTRLTAYTSTSLLPSLQASVRDGSTAFLEWSPPSATPNTGFRIRTSSNGAVPATMVLWIYRYQ